MFFRILDLRPGRAPSPGSEDLRRMMVGFTLGLGLVLGGCSPAARPHSKTNPVASEGPACRQVGVRDPVFAADSLIWSGRLTPELEPWCNGVGPALAYRPEGRSATASLAEITVVTWNVHGGGGDIDALLADLRDGRVDGGPTDSFVLLLQEVFRGGPDVPADPGPQVQGGKRVAPQVRHRETQSIEQVARRNGLHLLYVPSMRNGGPDDPPEDRGNAILSSLPLSGMEAFELPFERQRRVAVSARVTLSSEEGQGTEVRLVNVHLDPRSSWREVHRSLGAGRAEQARPIAARYGQEAVVILGGDLNTWFGGSREEAVRILSEVFPEPEHRGDAHTVSSPWLLPDLLLDHLFFRIPEPINANYSVIEDRYGSDHYPVVGWLEAAGQGPTGGAPHGEGVSGA